jgi:hypothetical protein
MIDDLSITSGFSKQEESNVKDCIAFLYGKLEAQQAFFREQITELKSSLAKVEEENHHLKVKLDQVEHESNVKVEKLEREKDELEEESRSNKVEIETIKCGKLVKLEEENHHLKIKLDQVEHENNVKVEKVEREKDELEKQARSNMVLIDTIKREKLALEGNFLTLKKAIELPHVSQSIWKSSSNSVSSAHNERMIDVINTSGFQTGIIQWKIKILTADGMRLGIVSSLEETYEKNLGDTPASWGYGGHGDAWHKNRRVGGWYIRFGAGSIVTFHLDLTEGGTLSVSVDEKPKVNVFDGMKAKHSKFIPAAYLYNKSRVEFLGFQEIHA